MSSGEYSTAMTNRSLRTIKTELEFLTDANILTPQQLASLLDQLPGPTPLNAPVTTAVPAAGVPVSRVTSRVAANNTQTNGFSPSPSPAAQPQQPPQPPQRQQQQQPQSPPAYPTAPAPPGASVLAYATALYAYTPTDTGDLALSPQDRVAVTEYMNAEWWKGRSERTGAEGIFPRSYVRVEEKGPGPVPLAPARSTSSYGNMPLEVSQGGADPNLPPSKTHEQSKKFGKKLGNAAIFGAGATLGGSVVNAIL